MGKSPAASCFKIIACAGGDSVDHDDLQSPQIKCSSDRRKWSFRKKSADHKILSNNLDSEEPLLANKENPESPAVSFQLQPDLTVPEKTSVVQFTEEKTELSAKLESKLSDTISAKEDDDSKPDEAVNEPSIIIIQAGIRRFLAEQELLKQRNIVKLQAAIRGHIVRRHAVGTLRCVQSIIKMQALVRARRAGQSKIGGKDNNDSMISGKREHKSNDTYTYVSIEKLLSNAFARQLMGSTPRTKPINIKCDPAKSDTAWKWLERWMSVSSVSNEGSQETRSTEEYHEENLVHSDGEEILVLHSSKSTLPDNELTKAAPTMIETGSIEVAQVGSLPEKGKLGNKPDSEQAETEAKKLSRKATNPAFIAAQSKFKELSLASTSIKLPSLSGHDLGVKSSLDKVSSPTSAVKIGSECGTELSISSTLDSPDRSVNGNEDEIKFVSDETEGQPKSGEKNDAEAIEKSPTLESDPPSTKNITNSDTVEPLNSINDEHSLHLEKKQEADLTDQRVDLESETSSRSHLTIPKSQTTPSSHVSMKPKKIKGEKSEPSRKKKSSSADKNPNQDSSSRHSLEKFPENNSGNRRNSFGPAKPEPEPIEYSSSNSLPSYMQATKSAKAKAQALLVANGSPRLSPDVHDKDIYIKKRHSLPGNSERQGSPRIQRSLSQVQQNAKGNATNSPQDRKWRR